MDSECAVCYSSAANCKLVCKHAFCKGCVKEWYHKSDDPTCPLCRRAMYFKGMHRVVSEWEQERIDQKNQEVFNQAFDEIFEDEDEDYSEEDTENTTDDESDAESDDGSWETWGGSQIDELDVSTEEITSLDITELEIPISASSWMPPVHVPSTDYLNCYSEFLLEEIKCLQKDYQKAMDMGMDFDVYLENLEYVFIEPVKNVWIQDDNMPKNLFVSKHKNMIRNKRSGPRVHSKNDMGITVVIYVMC